MAKQEVGPLMLGSTGKVGRALCAIWPEQSKLLCQHRDPDRTDGYFWDILNAPAPDLPHPISGIIGLMGVANGDASALKKNETLAIEACKLAEKLGGLRVLLASSQAVYGAGLGSLSEQSPCEAKLPYGRAKLAMEKAVSGWPNVTCLRIGNIMGCDSLSASISTGPVGLEQFANGNGPARMMIGPQDLADSLLALLKYRGDLPPILNLAAMPSVTMQDLLDATGAEWHWDPNLKGGLASLKLDLSLLHSIVPVAQTSAKELVEQARAAGWGIKKS